MDIGQELRVLNNFFPIQKLVNKNAMINNGLCIFFSQEIDFCIGHFRLQVAQQRQRQDDIPQIVCPADDDPLAQGGPMVDLIEFCILVENMIGHRNGYHQSLKAIQKSPLNEITLKKSKGRTENNFRNRTRLPVYILSSKNVRIPLNFQKCFSGVLVGVMKYDSFHLHDLCPSLQHEQIMWIFSTPDTHSFVPQPDLLIGIPIAMLYPFPAVV